MASHEADANKSVGLIGKQNSNASKPNTANNPDNQIMMLPRQKSRSRERRESRMFLVDGQLCWDNSLRRHSSLGTGAGFGGSEDFGGSSFDNDSSSNNEEAITHRVKVAKDNMAQLRRQTWPMERKLKVLRACKVFIKKHQGELAQSKQAKDMIANTTAMVERWWRHFKREFANFLVMVTPWEMRIKKIESHFGSVVASYFTFLRWIFWLNVANAIVMCCFVMVPELIEGVEDLTGMRKGLQNATEPVDPQLSEIWEFEGFLKLSPIFYGYYSNQEKTRVGYRNPLAYLCASVAIYMFCFFCISRKMAQNTKLSRIGTKDDEYTFCWTMFVGWDYMIGNSETAYNKVSSIVMNLKEGILEETEQSKDHNWSLLLLRVTANLLTILLLIASGYGVVLVVDRSENLPENASFLRKNELQLVLTCIQMSFPPIFDLIGILENYHPRKALSWQLGRILFLDFLNFYTLMFSLFGTVDQMGQQLKEVSGNITLMRQNTTYYNSLFVNTTTTNSTVTATNITANTNTTNSSTIAIAGNSINGINGTGNSNDSTMIITTQMVSIDQNGTILTNISLVNATAIGSVSIDFVANATSVYDQANNNTNQALSVSEKKQPTDNNNDSGSGSSSTTVNGSKLSLNNTNQVAGPITPVNEAPMSTTNARDLTREQAARPPDNNKLEDKQLDKPETSTSVAELTSDSVIKARDSIETTLATNEINNNDQTNKQTPTQVDLTTMTSSGSSSSSTIPSTIEDDDYDDVITEPSITNEAQVARASNHSKLMIMARSLDQLRSNRFFAFSDNGQRQKRETMRKSVNVTIKTDDDNYTDNDYEDDNNEEDNNENENDTEDADQEMKESTTIAHLLRGDNADQQEDDGVDQSTATSSTSLPSTESAQIPAMGDEVTGGGDLAATKTRSAAPIESQLPMAQGAIPPKTTIQTTISQVQIVTRKQHKQQPPLRTTESALNEELLASLARPTLQDPYRPYGLNNNNNRLPVAPAYSPAMLANDDLDEALEGRLHAPLPTTTRSPETIARTRPHGSRTRPYGVRQPIGSSINRPIVVPGTVQDVGQQLVTTSQASVHKTDSDDKQQQHQTNIGGSKQASSTIGGQATNEAVTGNYNNESPVTSFVTDATITTNVVDQSMMGGNSENSAPVMTMSSIVNADGTINNQESSETTPSTVMGQPNNQADSRDPSSIATITLSPSIITALVTSVGGTDQLAPLDTTNTSSLLPLGTGGQQVNGGEIEEVPIECVNGAINLLNLTTLAGGINATNDKSKSNDSDCQDIPVFKPEEIRGLNETMKDKLKSLCWETMFGQEMVKIVVTDLVFTVVSAVTVEFLRACFVRYCNRFFFWDLERKLPGYADFKTAENVLHLVNNQSTVWMGMFFAPGLPAINTVKLAVLMYVRSWAVLTCNIPHETVFKASRSNNFYFWILLINLFICILPVAYAAVWLRPSWHCGPFGGECRMYIVVTKLIKASLPPKANSILNYITSPGAIIPLLISLILIIYYLLSTVSSAKEANKELKAQLKKDKDSEALVPAITATATSELPTTATTTATTTTNPIDTLAPTTTTTLTTKTLNSYSGQLHLLTGNDKITTGGGSNLSVAANAFANNNNNKDKDNHDGTSIIGKSNQLSNQLLRGSALLASDRHHQVPKETNPTLLAPPTG